MTFTFMRRVGSYEVSFDKTNGRCFAKCPAIFGTKNYVRISSELYNSFENMVCETCEHFSKEDINDEGRHKCTLQGYCVSPRGGNCFKHTDNRMTLPLKLKPREENK